VLVEQIEQMNRMSAPQRLADFLVQLHPRSDGPCTIELPFEKSLIANRLGMKPESLSRALAKLRPFGVSVLRDAVTIEELGRLQQFVATEVEDGVG